MRSPLLLTMLTVIWTGFSLLPAAAFAEEEALAATEVLAKGRAIYAEHCASCHGDKGEGVGGIYPQPLVGDLSVKELTHYISAAMPEGEPEVCVGPDAAAVSEFIHNEFYSIIAQVRNQPPKVDLARLTVRQYRNSVTDLAASFSWQGRWDEKQGIDGDYYKNRRKNKENLTLERVDPGINFQFGEESPGENIEKEEFAIDWIGGVLAPETGWYEFVFVTENAGQLWVNNMKQPLIDARVKSGDQTEYRGSLYLLGGRVYPIRLDYYKSKSEKTASVQLKWKPPHSTEDLIPARNLSPNRFNYLMVIDTDFPPDDKSVGYERGVSVSKAWNDATTHAAMAVADQVLERIQELAKLAKEPEKHADQLKEFSVQFASRAFRRPLSDELRAFYVDRQFAAAKDPYTATKRVILLSLKSPRFLFPGAVAEGMDAYRTAEWLSLALWDSIPDEQLMKAARENRLQSREQIESQVRRMVQDIRTRAKVREFFHQWLQFGHFQELSKSGDRYPGFDKALVADLRTSVDLFVEDVVWSDQSDYRQLLLADSIYLNGRLAQFYGVDLPADSDFVKVPFEPEQRAGLLSHPYLLAGLAYEDASSPIHRGVFLARSLLGRFLKPPPIAVAPVPADLKPGMTTRERTHEQTASPTCYSCHSMINPLGFSLEHFDAVGRFRQQDQGKAVDAEGGYTDRQGAESKFYGARGLAQFLVASEEAPSAFTEQLFQYLIKQPVQAFGPEIHPRLKETLEKENFNIQKLLIAIATDSAVTARTMNEKK